MHQGFSSGRTKRQKMTMASPIWDPCPKFLPLARVAQEAPPTAGKALAVLSLPAHPSSSPTDSIIHQVEFSALELISLLSSQPLLLLKFGVRKKMLAGSMWC